MSARRTMRGRKRHPSDISAVVREPEPGYKLRRLLGRGGFGEVWEADSPSGIAVALKYMPFSDGLSAARELRAIQMMRALGHPSLIRVDKVWGLADCLVVAMELAEGSLADLFDASRESGIGIAPQELLSYMAQTAETLDFLNARQHDVNGLRVGIQHCDVKPSNLLLCGDTVKVCDFGLSAVTTAPLRLHRKTGTRQFMAPEVRQGRLSDRTDQFSLALTYCCLRGLDIPAAADKSDSDSLTARDLARLPVPERAVVARALALVPGSRWPTCVRFVTELAAVLCADVCFAAAGESPATMTYSATEEDCDQELSGSQRG